MSIIAYRQHVRDCHRVMVRPFPLLVARRGCGRPACADAVDPIVRKDYARIAQNWVLLARSFQSVESLEQFLTDSQKHRNSLPPELPGRNRAGVRA
jgi:hypothetical protein